MTQTWTDLLLFLRTGLADGGAWTSWRSGTTGNFTKFCGDKAKLCTWEGRDPGNSTQNIEPEPAVSPSSSNGHQHPGLC